MSKEDKFEKWAIDYVIRYWGWPKDTGPDDIAEMDSYDDFKAFWMAGYRAGLDAASHADTGLRHWIDADL